MSNLSNDASNPSFRLTINGRNLDGEVQEDISRITVQYEMNLPSMFSFEYNTFNETKGTWQGIDLKSFNLGDKTKVYMGMGELVSMMEGEITAIEPVFDEDYSRVVIRGYDSLYRMRFGSRLHVYTNTTDSAIVKYLSKKSGIEAVVDSPTVNYPYLLQNHQSDYDFLMKRANRIGYEVLIEKGKLHFRESQEGKAPVETLMYGKDLDSFSASLKALTQGSKVEVRGWDQSKKKAMSSMSSQGSEISRMGGRNTGFSLTSSKIKASPIAFSSGMVVTPEDAQNVAKGTYNKELIHFVEGEGECSGLPSIRAGVNVNLKGLGDKFSGTYYVVGALHSYDMKGYITRFLVRRTAV